LKIPSSRSWECITGGSASSGEAELRRIYSNALHWNERRVKSLIGREFYLGLAEYSYNLFQIRVSILFIPNRCKAMASRCSKFLHFDGKLWGEFEKQPPKPPFFVLCGI
jgi:hypothetical protein